MRRILACLNGFLIFGHLVVSEESLFTAIDASDLVFPDNSEINGLFTPIDDPLLASSLEMTGNNDAMKDTNLFIADGESDFCASSSSLPVTDVAAGSEIGIAARGDSCESPDTSGAGAKAGAGTANLDSIYTPEDEALRTLDEAGDWWCSGNSLGWAAVCSTELIPPDITGYYIEGTQSKLFLSSYHSSSFITRSFRQRDVSYLFYMKLISALYGNHSKSRV